MVRRELYLVSYDIQEDKSRSATSQYLLGYTTGRQKSVYECWLTAAELVQVRSYLEALLETGDNLHIFKLPTAQRAEYLGRATSLNKRAIIVG